MKKGVIILLCITGALLIYWFIDFGMHFGPGSYPFVENYTMTTDEPTLIKAIERFKSNNPKYKVPMDMLLHDGRITGDPDHSYWYHIYFYYPEEHLTIHTWTRPDAKGSTSFAFVGLSEGLGTIREINRDFSKEENKAQKRKFELLIVEKIKAILDSTNAQ